MSNVLKFPKGAVATRAPEVNGDSPEASQSRGVTVKTVFGWLLLILRLPVFLVMYWLRLPVLFVCNLVSLPAMLVWLFSLYAFPDKHVMVWGFGVISFVAFAMAWVYDLVLIAISPEDMLREL